VNPELEKESKAFQRLTSDINPCFYRRIQHQEKNQRRSSSLSLFSFLYGQNKKIKNLVAWCRITKNGVEQTIQTEVAGWGATTRVSKLIKFFRFIDTIKLILNKPT
jgi:hypothetical protein